MCFLQNALSSDEVQLLRDKIDRQAEAERNLGELAPESARGNRQNLPNMVNKGKEFTDLVERELTDELGTLLLGKNFLPRAGGD